MTNGDENTPQKGQTPAKTPPESSKPSGKIAVESDPSLTRYEFNTSQTPLDSLHKYADIIIPEVQEPAIAGHHTERNWKFVTEKDHTKQSLPDTMDARMTGTESRLALSDDGGSGIHEITRDEKMSVVVRTYPKRLRPISSTSDCFHSDGRNTTPTTAFALEFPEIQSSKMRLPLPTDGENSRDSMFQQAIHLMTERCPSMAQGDQHPQDPAAPLVQNTLDPYGVHVPQYFYVQQGVPAPMTPLPAWRGYGGNVYFEPIKVNQATYSVPEQPDPVPLDNVSEPLRDILMKSKRAQSSNSLPIVPVHDMQPPGQPKARSMTAAPGTRVSSGSSYAGSGAPRPFTYKGARQMVVLDKQTIFDRKNDRLHEDITWLVGQESTGSLRLELGSKDRNARKSTQASRFMSRQIANSKAAPVHMPQEPKSNQYSKAPHPREKICRGSVAHKIYALKNKHLPFLSVSGDRYTKQHLPPSPILRTQTQYSQSSQRTLNSPDMYHPGYERLPPLEQLRASLKHMDVANHPHGSSMQPVIPALERLKFEDPSTIASKPMVKYSAEVRNSARRAAGTMHLHRQQRVL